MTTFRSLTLVVAVLLLAGGALTGFHLLNSASSAPVPAQLSTADAGDRPAPGSTPPVERIPPAPEAPVTHAPAATSAPQRPAPTQANRAPASEPTTVASDRDPGSWRGGQGSFPGHDQYPFRPGDPNTGSRPGQDRSTPTDSDRARQQVANAICDRYHIPREQCQIEPAGR